MDAWCGSHLCKIGNDAGFHASGLSLQMGSEGDTEADAD